MSRNSWARYMAMGTDLPNSSTGTGEDLYRTLLEGAADAVLLADSQGRYVEANEPATTMLGYSRSELLGMTIADLIPPEELADLSVPDGGRAAEPSGWFDRRLRRKDGGLVHVEMRQTTIRLDGRVLLQAICRDLTDREALEAAHNREHKLFLATVRSLAATVDARDVYTHSHSQQVAFYCKLLAEELDLPASEVETIELAGLLHDIGKIAVPDTILQKPGRLTSEEWEIMRSHAARGAEILSTGDNPVLASIVPMVRSHHERWAGGGYPDDIYGEEIPLGARVIAIADAFDTLTTVRPYKVASTLDEALAELSQAAGRQFAPEVAAAFLQVIERDRAVAAPYLEPIKRGTEPGTSSLPRSAGLRPPAGGRIGPQSLSYQEQQRLAAHMQSLYNISRGFTEVKCQSDVIAAAAQLARDHFGAESVYLMERHDAISRHSRRSVVPDMAPWELVARWGWESTGELLPFALPTSRLRDAWRAMLEDRQAIAVPDLAAGSGPEVGPLVAEKGWRSGIFIPLHAAGQALGALAVGFRSNYRTFTSDDLELADTLGGETARALAGLQLQQAAEDSLSQIASLERVNLQLTRRSRDLTALNMIAGGLTELLDLATLCRRLVEMLRAAYGYTVISVALVEGSKLRLQSWIGSPQAAEGIEWDNTFGVTGRVARTGRPSLVEDVTKDPDYYLVEPTVRSEVCVPLLGPDRVLGVLNVESNAEKPLDEGDLQLLTILAPQIVIALENAQLYASAQQQASQLGLINRVSKMMAYMVSDDAQTLLERATSLLQRELGYINVSVLIYEATTADMICHASAGKYERVLPVGYRQALDLGLVGWVAQHGTTLVANDVKQEPRFYQAGPGETPAAELVTPLIHEGRLIGVLDVESEVTDCFGTAEVQILETLADQLAMALAQAGSKRSLAPAYGSRGASGTIAQSSK